MALTRFPRIIFFIVLLALPMAAFAANVGKPSSAGSIMEWKLNVSGHDSVTLYISDPEGNVSSYVFKNGKNPAVSLQDLGGLDGTYIYELLVTPKVPPGVQKQLESARASNDSAAAQKIMREAGLLNTQSQSGAITAANGTWVSPDLTEATATDSATAGGRKVTTDAANRPNLTPVTNDQVIPDDLIVQGSICVGFDCVNNESFGFDTIRLKENNTRIKFEDTSVGTFPTNDWELTANDSASGGSNRFSITNTTGGNTPFTITAGTLNNNAIFVDSTGRVGFHTSTPVLDLHVATSNTPAIRLEQNNSGGFTAQTWDIAGNEANFFVRDVTSGSRLPFRIRPGAPTSSIDISADGDVGIGTASPDAKLHVSGGHAHITQNSDTTETWLVIEDTDDSAGSQVPQIEFVGNGSTLGFLRYGSSGAQFRSAAAVNLVTVSNDGNVGIGTTSPASDLVIANGGTTSSINAGSAQFTVASSRTFKENIEPIVAPSILDKIEAVPVVKYDFKNDGPKDRMGLIAEDFYTVFQRGDDKHIDGQDVQMALWLAVQQLTQENKALTERLNALEKERTQTPH